MKSYSETYSHSISLSNILYVQAYLFLSVQEELYFNVWNCKPVYFRCLEHQPAKL